MPRRNASEPSGTRATAERTPAGVEEALARARERLERHLARRGLKHTRQREAILEAFVRAGGHLSSEELYERVRERLPGIGAATVYRTLKLLCEAGVAQESHFRDGVTVYEQVHGHHDHLVCVGCGKVVEFECSMIEEAQTRIAREYGFRLTNHRHDLYGLCPECQRAGDGQR